MSQLVIALSGRKQSGKSSSCHFIISELANRTITSRGKFGINSHGLLLEDGELISQARYKSILDLLDAKIYSFADLLKQFCVDIFSIPPECCYGTDEEKNRAMPHLLWENLPKEMRPSREVYIEEKYVKFSGVTHAGSKHVEYRTGPMTGREMMQIFGSEIVRKLYPDAWAKATYSLIEREGRQYAFLADCRFPNEISCGKHLPNIKFIRLLRKVAEDTHISETALDDYPLENYDLVVDNQNMSLAEQCAYVKPYLDKWLLET